MLPFFPSLHADQTGTAFDKQSIQRLGHERQRAHTHTQPISSIIGKHTAFDVDVKGEQKECRGRKDKVVNTAGHDDDAEQKACQ